MYRAEGERVVPPQDVSAQAVATTTEAPVRNAAIDALRGVVMVVMALDHVRDFVHLDAMSFSPEDLSHTTPAAFLTRWVTHVCAPTFLLLAGIAAYRRLRSEESPHRLRSFLASRGVWLIIVELTIFRLLLNFRMVDDDPWLILVLSALGASMLLLAPLVALRPRHVGVIGLAIVIFHNLADAISDGEWGVLAPVLTLLYQPGAIDAGGRVVVVGYPILPWFAVLALGFAAGELFDMPAHRRRRLLASAGIALVAGFLVLRALNLYGDPQPWSAQSTPGLTVLSFLRVTKYPPSLQFLAITLGMAALGLALLDQLSLTRDHPLAVMGRVPLFYYLGHFLLAHVIASSLVWLRYRDFPLAFLNGPFPSLGGHHDAFPSDLGWSLATVYMVWIAVVLTMYRACVWYAKVKDRHRDKWWMSYL